MNWIVWNSLEIILNINGFTPVKRSAIDISIIKAVQRVQYNTERVQGNVSPSRWSTKLILSMSDKNVSSLNLFSNPLGLRQINYKME